MLRHRFVSLRSSLSVAAALVASSAVSNAHAAPGDAPPLLSSEGRLLRADGIPEGGLVNLVFRLYESATGGADAWSESQYILLGTGGYYAVHLGSITLLPPFDGRNYWLGVTIAGEAEMVPRTRLVSVPYALRATSAARADDAARLGGDAASEFLRRSSDLGLPTGMVSFFNLSACPAGWTALVGAQGRYMVGLPISGTLAGTAGTALTNLEDRPVGLHTHGITDPGHGHTLAATSGGEVRPNRLPIVQNTWNDAPVGVSGEFTNISISNTGITGTNAPYLQLLVCQKD